MTAKFSPELVTLATYLAGEFSNQEQAISQPTWYVNLRLWQRPVNLFTEDSLTLFAEQATILNLEYPYRPRILRLRYSQVDPQQLQVQYYVCKDIESVRGGASHPEKLRKLTTEDLEFLPNCTLNVQVNKIKPPGYHFKTQPVSATPCSFTYQGQTYQVFLGFEVTVQSLQTFDKGIDPQTNRATWGALLGPYCFTKEQDFSSELLNFAND